MSIADDQDFGEPQVKGEDCFRVHENANRKRRERSMDREKTVTVALTLDELLHLRWALSGFHQQVGTCNTVAARAATIDDKLRRGVIFLTGTPQ